MTMRSHYVDFRSPIVSQDTFARSVATQSHDVFTSLIHNSAIARHLPRELDTSRDVARYVRKYSVFYTMHELHDVLAAVEDLLPCDDARDEGEDNLSSAATAHARRSASRLPSSFFGKSAGPLPSPHALPHILRRCLSLPEEKAQPVMHTVCGSTARDSHAVHFEAEDGTSGAIDSDMRTAARGKSAMLEDSTDAAEGHCSETRGEGNMRGPPVQRTCDTAVKSEMALWLCLLAWTQQALLTLLRDLCAAQGSVAWSAWYWSWAQLHPLHASVHQALSSVTFWRRGASGGLPAQLRHTQHIALNHLDALRRLFRAIVSCIGATYGILEQLNAKVAELNRRCDSAVGTAASCHTSVFQADAVLRRSMHYLRHRSVPELHFDPAPHEPHTTLSALSTNTGPVAIREMSSTRTGGTRRWATRTPPPPSMVSARDVAEALAVAICDAMDQLSALLPPSTSPATVPQRPITRSAEQAAHPATEEEGREGDVHNLAGPQGTTRLRRELRIQLPAVLMQDTRQPNAQTDGVAVSPHACLRRLRCCVERCGDYTACLGAAALREHHPPHARNAGRVALAAAILVPSVIWLSSKTLEELWATAQRAYALGCLLFRSYVTVPLRQMKESLFYIPPGTQAQRESFEHDARALADIISDYHQYCFPGKSVEERGRMRAHTLDCLRAGITDEEGYGLVQDHYRRAVQHPLLYTLFGQLPRILLIQMSHHALEISRVTNGIDEVLMSNDLNFKAMAVMPLFLLSGMGALWLLYRWRTSYQPVRRRMKRLWRAMYRLLSVRPTPLLLPPPLALRPTAMAASPAETRCASHYSRSGAITPCRSTRLRDNNDGDAEEDGFGTSGGPCATSNAADRTVTDERTRSRQPRPRARCEDDDVERAEERSGDEAAVRVDAEDAADEMDNENSSYDQGALLLLVHVMRTTVLTQLAHDDFADEWLEDLNDLESVQTTPAQRLEILRRMRDMHPILH